MTSPADPAQHAPRTSRIFEKFASEEAFLAAARAALRAFDYERKQNSDGSVDIKAPGHGAVTRWKRLRWRPFRSQAQRISGYEPPAIAVMSFILHTFDVRTFYDIGSSNGYIALLAATTEGRSVTAHAFEMQNRGYREMQAELAARPELAGRFVPHHAGMSDRHEGTRDIWFSRTQMFETEPQPHQYREAWWRRLKFWLRGVKDRDRLVKANILLTSIDHFARQDGNPPELLKIDVDGYETLVVPGGMETFAQERPFLLLELHKDELLQRFGKSRRDVVVPLLDLGYRAAHISDHNSLQADLIPLDAGSPQWTQQRTDMFLFY